MLTENRENLLKGKDLKIGNLLVEIKYASNNKKIDECMLNILKQKIK